MKYYYKTKSVPIVFGDGWLVNLEKSCFGWRKEGQHDESYEYDEHTTHNYTEYHDGIEWDVTEHRTERKTGWTSYQDFYRISPYSFNPIFALFEFLSGIFSWVRRIVMSIVGYIAALLVGLAVIAMLLDPSMIETGLQLVGSFLALYVFLIVIPSVLVALCALGLRKLFGIDKKLAESMIKNGYDPNW